MMLDAMSNRDARHSGQLTKHIGLGHGIALYVSAVLGAGVLVLPGQVASLAGPASLLAWAFACAMGVPLAWMFACLARAHPDAGGVATYVREAFGPTVGGVTGWCYFVAGSVGQTIVPLTGGYYVAQALHLGRAWTFVIAALILSAAVVGNLLGLKVGSRAQVALAGGVAVSLVVTIAVAIPQMHASRLTPFAPHGIASVGAGVIVLFFAFAGWEAVAQLVGEFSDADRDVPLAVAATIAVVTILYLGVATAVVLTGTYGSGRVDHVALGLLLQQTFGGSASIAAAITATVISLGTTNAFIAGVSRLAYSLALSGWLPRSAGRVTRASVPIGGVLTVAGIAYSGLALALAFGWGTESLVVVPSTLVVAVYLLAAAAGARLLRGTGRLCALITIAATLVVAPAAARHVVIPLATVLLALAVRSAISRSRPRQTPPADRQHTVDS
jgi:amino acid efflux transporter